MDAVLRLLPNVWLATQDSSDRLAFLAECAPTEPPVAKQAAHHVLLDTQVCLSASDVEEINFAQYAAPHPLLQEPPLVILANQDIQYLGMGPALPSALLQIALHVPMQPTANPAAQVFGVQIVLIVRIAPELATLQMDAQAVPLGSRIHLLARL